MRTQPIAGIDHQENHIGLQDRQPGLAGHGRNDSVLDDGLKAAGIDRDETTITDLCLPIVAVPSQARTIVNQRRPTAGEPIEQR